MWTFEATVAVCSDTTSVVVRARVERADGDARGHPHLLPGREVVDVRFLQGAEPADLAAVVRDDHAGQHRAGPVQGPTDAGRDVGVVRDLVVAQAHTLRQRG